ncbi:MAG: T9SS type A sorting domain-containing protein [Bacteroidia bacterium]
MKQLLTIFLSIFYSLHAIAQWDLLGLSDVKARCVASDETNLYVGTDFDGIFLSTDNGLTWNSINTGLSERVVRVIETNQGNIYAGTWNGLFLSDNNGSSWTPINNGLTNLDIRDIVALGSILYVGTAGGGVFKSLNNGSSWTAINNGLKNLNALSLAINSQAIFAGTYIGIFMSSDGGSTWNPPSGVNIQTNSIKIFDSLVIAGTIDGFYKSENYGKTWIKSSNGITEDFVTTVTMAGDKMLSGTWGKSIFLSSDTGNTWTSHNSSFLGNFISDFVIHNRSIIVSTLYEGVWRYSGVSFPKPGINTSHLIGLFPNPTNNVLKFTQIPKSVEIMDSNGKTVKVYGQKNEINVSGLAKGMYFIRIKINEKLITKKVIIN